MSEETSSIIQHRLDKLERWRNAGIDPYPFEFATTHTSTEIKDNFDRLVEDEARVTFAGRIMSLRGFGKSTFAVLQDEWGKTQVYLQLNMLGEEIYERVSWLDMGDIIGVSGTMFRTRTEEITIKVVSFVMLSKSLEPLPEKWHGLADKELRYRRRYVDLTVNPEIREVFRKRATALTGLRSFFDSRGFLEVETPVLQTLYGGASARPFKTHHNALNIPLFLRIADELYLKRLIVGGFHKVYEVCKDFRNEGMDREHNPEFTMIEFYWAYVDYRAGMRLTRELIQTLAQTVCGGTTIPHGEEGEIDLGGEWPERPYLEALNEAIGQDASSMSDADLADLCKKHGQASPAGASRGRLYDLLFKLTVEPGLTSPVFITDYPQELSPLAKKHRTEPGLVERFELFIGGTEFANGFSELNDPHDQRERFEAQVSARSKGDDEAQPMDEDYVNALEFGMPPTAGVGVGFDRLIMLLTNQRSIRDVLFFPQMRPPGSVTEPVGAEPS